MPMIEPERCATPPMTSARSATSPSDTTTPVLVDDATRSESDMEGDEPDDADDGTDDEEDLMTGQSS